MTTPITKTDSWLGEGEGEVADTEIQNLILKYSLVYHIKIKKYPTKKMFI